MEGQVCADGPDEANGILEGICRSFWRELLLLASYGTLRHRWKRMLRAFDHLEKFLRKGSGDAAGEAEEGLHRIGSQTTQGDCWQVKWAQLNQGGSVFLGGKGVLVLHSGFAGLGLLG